MIKIKKIEIQRFRSIIFISLEINTNSNFISICGQNNVGKTNVLRAINIFFNPITYNPKLDIPNLKNATWGGAVHPKITITFFDDASNNTYIISRDFKDYNDSTTGLLGIFNRANMSLSEINKLINRIQYFYIESANLVMPDIIEMISQDMITLEYDKARFSKSRRELKDAYDTYIDGLREILDIFANDISGTFKWFRDNWNIVLNVPKNSDTFRDLISDDVTLSINDRGSVGVVEKGSGLQRLAIILLYFEIATRMSTKKNIIISIDEPDIFLHEGLQRKLKTFFDNKSKDLQIIYTTHSKVFIDTYRMQNTFLLDAKLSEQYIKRRNKIVDVIESFLVDINTDEGYELVCQHLGIEEKSIDMLEKYNLLVEGECDKNYINELSKFFELDQINIITANGADNMIHFLNFYEAYYKNYDSSKPKIRVVLDNDSKGREVYKRIKAKNYNHIIIKIILLPNFLNDSNMNLEKNNTNNEIEDFIYPEVMCYLINILLGKRNMVELNSRTICRKINQPAFKISGILTICDHEKNDSNPETGAEISFISSSHATCRIKDGLAGLFKIEGNRILINLLNECNEKYPDVKDNLLEILTEF